MTEVKTLKDIRVRKEFHDSKILNDIVETKILKKEAIKWIIKDIKDWNAPGGLFQSEIIQRWKERFNITEEDFAVSLKSVQQEKSE